MNSSKNYFQDLALWRRVSSISTTYEGVAPCALARLGLARARLVT
jgi:hypothetical protein